MTFLKITRCFSIFSYTYSIFTFTLNKFLTSECIMLYCVIYPDFSLCNKLRTNRIQDFVDTQLPPKSLMSSLITSKIFLENGLHGRNYSGKLVSLLVLPSLLLQQTVTIFLIHFLSSLSFFRDNERTNTFITQFIKGITRSFILISQAPNQGY